MKKNSSKLIVCLLLNVICISVMAQKDIYEIRTYLLKSEDQVQATDQYLKDAYLPAMHRLGFHSIGVFKPLANDTAAIKKIYVLVTYPSVDNWRKTKISLQNDKQYQSAAKPFAEADTNKLPFSRIESALLEAFPDHIKLTPPSIKVNGETIYELRSYESPTDMLHFKKVTMFNKGGEIVLFKRLDFNAVFYAEVLSGGHLPNLMYMIVFENSASREAHWKSFGAAPEWKKLTADPFYESNISVSHIDSILMHRTEYSDL